MTIPPPDTNTPENKLFSQNPPPPLDGFTPQEFKTRRDKLRSAFPDKVILLRGADEDDSGFRAGAQYTQYSSFFYLTGVDTPGAFLALLPQGVNAALGVRTLKSEVKEILFLPSRDAARETWTGGKLGPGEETQKLTGIEAVTDSGGFYGAAAAWLSQNSSCATITPYGAHAKQTVDYYFMQAISERAPVVQFQDIGQVLGTMRAIKSESEISRIEAAIAITLEGHKVARKLIEHEAGKYEYEIEAGIFEAFRSRGAHNAFGMIVGAGINGTVLHYEDNNSILKQGDMVVVDIGAKYGHYCGDLTRTYCVGGNQSARQHQIYDLVEQAYHRVIADFKPGIDSLMVMSERCKEFLRASPLRAKDTGGNERTMDVFMPHGLSHHLGLDVHDVGERDTPLPNGAVITVEPGLYIPSESIGVRLEDDFLVTGSGLKKLGPK